MCLVSFQLLCVARCVPLNGCMCSSNILANFAIGYMCVIDFCGWFQNAIIHIVSSFFRIARMNRQKQQQASFLFKLWWSKYLIFCYFIAFALARSIIAFYLFGVCTSLFVLRVARPIGPQSTHSLHTSFFFSTYCFFRSLPYNTFQSFQIHVFVNLCARAHSYRKSPMISIVSVS